MRDGPQAARGHVLASYAAAVAVAVTVFYGGIILDAHLHPIAQPSGPAAGVTEATFALLEVFLVVLVAALVPVWVGLAAFRSARVTHPAWFAAYGVATGLLMANVFRDPTTGLALPGLAGAAGGLTFRAIMGQPAELVGATEALSESTTAELQAIRGQLADHEAETAYLSDALASDDPALVTLALKEIGTARRIPVALDKNPPLGEVLRVVRELGIDLVAVRVPP